MRIRHLLLATAAFAAVPLLTSCIKPPVTASGTVTIAWDSTAVAYPNGAGEGDFIDICRAAATQCGPQWPGTVVYTFFPADGATSAVLQPGTPVIRAGGGATSLPGGDYTVQVNQYFLDTANPPVLHGPQSVGDLLRVTVAGDPTEDPGPPDWLQQYGLTPADGSCLDGYTRSWAQWMNDGQGGDVGTRTEHYDKGTGTWQFRSLAERKRVLAAALPGVVTE